MAFINPCLELLMNLGFISKQGPVDKETVEDVVCVWCAPIGQRVQCTKHFHACQSEAYEHCALILPQKCDLLATQEASPPATGPGPSTSCDCNKHQAINPPQTPLSSSASSPASTPTPTYCTHHSVQPVMAKGLIVCSPNPKDKDTEDNSMAVDKELVTPSEGDADMDGELIDFPDSSNEPAEKKDASS
ncbi:hypothetical protein C0995_006479 [Termitomyces sp. Mi166|nr:hypothetical protein C0995_006479 [Termitomyces sp. Mi166\